MFDLISMVAFIGVGLYLAFQKFDNKTFYLSLAAVFIVFFLLGRWI